SSRPVRSSVPLAIRNILATGTRKAIDLASLLRLLRFCGGLGKIAEPCVDEVVAGVTHSGRVADPKLLRLYPVLPQSAGERPIGDGLPLEVAPRALGQVDQAAENGCGRERGQGRGVEHRLQISQQSDSQARLRVSGGTDQL